jgi:hypothetical protein
MIGLAPKQLLSAADVLLTDPPSGLEGRWPSAVTILLRQALERAMLQLWLAKAPGLQDASYRAQLLCLRRYVDQNLAARADHTWHALSAACHQRAYDLPPTAGELAGWYETVEELTRAVARIVDRASSG